MNLPGVGKREMALKVFRKQGGEELLIHQAEQEERAVAIANRLLHEADAEPIDDAPANDERASQLTRGIVSLVDGDIEGFYAQEYARVRCKSKYSDVLPFVDLEPDQWTDQKLEWQSAYDLPEKDAEEVAQKHVDMVFGVSVDEFVAEVVAWPDGKDADVIRRFLAGDPYDMENRIFVGHRTAHTATEYALDKLDIE